MLLNTDEVILGEYVNSYREPGFEAIYNNYNYYNCNIILLLLVFVINTDLIGNKEILGKFLELKLN